MKLPTDKATLISATGGDMRSISYTPQAPDNRAQRDVHGNCERSEQCRAVPVVVRYLEVLGKYYICHACSYQNAFRSALEGFDTREQAEEYARAQGCTVERHRDDQLQADAFPPLTAFGGQGE